jgi:hypothetical protein
MILVVLRATPTLFEGNLVAAPPKSKRGLASSDPVGAVDPLDALGQVGQESTG